MTFSATDAAFEGFRIVRRHPKAVAVWAGVTVIFSLSVSYVLIAMAGPQMMIFTTASQTGAEPTPEQMLALFGALGPAYALMMLLGLAYYAVLMPAVERAVLKPETKTPGFLSLGSVELRHLALNLVLGLLLFTAYLAFVLIVGLLVGGLSALVSPVVGVLIAIPAVIIGLLGMVVLMARFVMAGPVALIEGGLGLSRSWALSKGRTWPLVGGLVITLILTMVVGLLMIVIASGLAAAIGGMDAVGAIFNPDMSSAAAYFSVATLGYMVISTVSSALTFALTIGYGAACYSQLAGEGQVKS